MNDPIALKTTNVSTSPRRASSIATDTARVVFVEDSSLELLTLFDVCRASCTATSAPAGR